MKKLLTMLSGLIMMLAAAVPVHAVDLYIYGEINGSKQWNNPKYLQATSVGTNKFAIELNITSTSYFRLHDANQYGDRYWAPQSNNNVSVTTEGTTYYVNKKNSSSEGSAFYVEPGTYVLIAEIYAAGDKKDWGFTLKKMQPYLYGNINGSNGWDAPDKNQVKLNRTEKYRQWAVDLDITSESKFKLTNADELYYTTTNGDNDQTMVNGTVYSTKNISTPSANKAFTLTPGKWKVTATAKDNLGWEITATSITPESGYNHTLFVGIASSNRHQIQYNEDTKTYEVYKFYVNEEDLDKENNEFGFRFYSEPNGGVWMGNDGKTVDGKTVGKVIGEDYDLGAEITTSGIKRYFLKETGAYAINVKSYDPEKDKVVFTLSKLNTDVVLPELYIGGTWMNGGLDNGKEKIQIPSSHGKYQPLTITVGDDCAFRFYSEKYNGNWMGPVYTNGINVDAEGTLPYTAVGNNKTFNLAEGGTYTIKVSEYLANERKVTFTVTRETGSSVSVPKTLNIRTNKNSWGTPIAMTRQDGAGDNDRNICTFSAEVDYTANSDFQFHFIEKEGADWSDYGIVCYPNANELSVSTNTPAIISNVETLSKDPLLAWSYISTESDKITVLVHFKKNGTATVEVVGKSDKGYYFIGDMNNWFSNEFDGNLGGKDSHGETIAQGINENRWKADKDNWKFEYMGDGWYRFNSFPGNLLSGHFQIVSDGSWEYQKNEVYSHVICVQEIMDADDDDVRAEKIAGYRAFKMNRITRDDIRNGREYRVRKRGESQPNGSNLGTQCNAVEGAEFWFNPGNDTEAPRIRIKGTPKDYFIFYNMEEAKVKPDTKKSLENGTETSEYWVRAAINSGKSNTNNYFLAGIEYGGYPLPFYDINGNTGAHMNVGEGIDLAPYDLKNMTERELNNLFFSNSDIVNSILDEGRLPNGRDISGYKKVWVAKIPSGFENPAGTKYNMTFNKAMTDADRSATHTLTTRHYYFFPQQNGLHVHVNIDEITDNKKVKSAKVAYRLYKTDNQYNTIAVLHGSDVDAEGHRETKILHPVGSALPLTEDSEATNGIGWYECNSRLNKDMWGNPDVPKYTDTYWNVSWIDGEEENAGARREVAYDDNSAFVQFRLTIEMEEEEQPASRAAEGQTLTFYLPERVDVANDDNHYWFENSDLYAKLKASDLPDGVLTGISEIVEDTDNGPAVYYNLQGVRVDNPTAGNIYIKVTRKGSEKILF